MDHMIIQPHSKGIGVRKSDLVIKDLKLHVVLVDLPLNPPDPTPTY